MLESRRHVRADLSHPVYITLPTDPTEQESRIANVSESGMWVVMLDPPPVGTIIKFDLKLDTGRVRGFGHVVWIRFSSKNESEPCGMGVEFRSLTQDDKIVLRLAVVGALDRSGQGVEAARIEQRIA